MRKILSLFLLLLGVIVFFASCGKEYDLEDQLIQKYYKILYVKDSGIQNVTVNTASANPSDSITVVKAGLHISETASAKVKSLSIAEMQSLFGTDADGYTVVPQDFYTLSNADFTIAGDDRINNVGIKFDTAKLRAAVKANPKLKLALPLQLYSEGDTINTKMDKMLIKINVITPVVNFDISDYNPSMVYKTLDVKVGAAISNYDSNISAFTCGLSDVDITSLTTAYNLAHGTNYDPIPASSCSFTNFSVAKGSKTATTILKVLRSGLVNDHTYLLPIQLKAGNGSSQLDFSTDIQYLVVSNPKYGWDAADKTKWKIVLCNDDNKFGGATGADGAGAPAMIDNNTSTYWMFGSWNDWFWQVNDGDDYDYDFKDYHAFFGDRGLGDGHDGQQIIVIDMKKTISVLGIGLVQRQDLGCLIKKCDFAISNDAEFKFVPVKNGGDIADYNKVALNNWTPLMTWDNIPAQKAISWQKIDTTKNPFGIKGRFLKIMPLGGAANTSFNHGSSIAEISVMQIVSIDGNAIE